MIKTAKVFISLLMCLLLLVGSSVALGLETQVYATAQSLVVGIGTGLTGEYYDNKDFTSLKLTRVDPAVSFDWGTGSPEQSISSDTFSIRWTGFVEPKYSETYTFYAIADDGVRLWVNNQLLIDSWIDQGSTEHYGTISLEAGKKYNIKMEYYENENDASAKLLWSSSSQSKEIIPSNHLYIASTDVQAPSIPANISSYAKTGNSISLFWSASTDNVGVTGYEVYRDNVKLGTTRDPVFNDTGLLPNRTYSYKVAAFDAAGNISATSSSVSITTSGDTVNTTPNQFNLSSYFNEDGFSYDSGRSDGNYDGINNSYSADLAYVVHSYDGVIYNMGSFSDRTNNSVQCTGQTIQLDQKRYASIRFLGSATNGDKSDTFRINYTDGTHSDISVTMRDWCATDTSGQKLVQTMNQRHSGSQDQQTSVSIFAYYLTPAGDRNVQSITLPDNRNMHLLAMTLVPSDTQSPVTGSGTGLTGEYFNNSDLSDLELTRVDPTVNFDWGTGAPDHSIASDTFSVRWSGYVEPEFTEAYTFYTTADDGVRLWVNNQLLIDSWSDQGASEHSGTITLNAGNRYNIKLEYYENQNYASSKLQWSSYSQSKEVIPSCQLYPLSTDTQAPSAPGSLSAYARTSGSISLMWSSSTDNVGVTGYDIYRDNTKTGTTQGLLFTDAGLLPGRTYSYKAVAFDAAGNFSSESRINASTDGTPSDTHPSGSGNGTGLRGEYYDSKNLTQLKLTRVDPMINFDWGNKSPARTIGQDTFSVRWTGYIEPRYSENYTFYALSDDGIRVWINGTKIIDQWNDHSAAESSGNITLAAGNKVEIKVEYYENTIDAVAKLYWSSPSQSREIVPKSRLYPQIEGHGTGLKGYYYKSMDLSKLKVIRNNDWINYDWGKKSPASGIGSDKFSVRWVGQIEPRYSETYTFHALTDDGVRLWINGKLIISRWKDHNALESTGKIKLEAGKRYDIKMEYYENKTNAVARLFWSSPSQTKEIIPKSQLYMPE